MVLDAAGRRPGQDGLELAINSNKLLGKQVEIPAQHHGLPTCVPYAGAIVLAEVGYCLEVGRQPASQPHQFDDALGFALFARSTFLVPNSLLRLRAGDHILVANWPINSDKTHSGRALSHIPQLAGRPHCIALFHQTLR